MRYITFFVLCFMIFSCNKKTTFPDVDLPENVEMGESEVYLNGDLVEYEARIFIDTVNTQLQATFSYEPDFSVLNKFGFVFLPIEVGDYILHTDRELYKGAKTSFSQLVNSEYEGWEYELIRADDGFFNITSLDTINQTIQGKFKAYFEVVEKNGYYDTKLPEEIRFDGVFHENYIKG